MEKKILVGIEETEEKFNITYYCAENEEEYYNGNHDVIDHWSINKNSLNNSNDENELIEQIKLYDTNFNNKEIVII